MKQILLTLLLCCSAALAQVTYTAPQSDTQKIFNAVTTAQSSGCLQNQGQNIWASSYSITVAASLVDYRLEYSFNSDAATCTTGTWFAFSDDATDLSQGTVVGVGAYPYVRANLVAYGSGGGTFTSWYTASSAAPGTLHGNYNPTQLVREVVFSNVNDGATQVVSIPVPYGSTGGMLVAQDFTHVWGAGASLSINAFIGKEFIGVGPSAGYLLPTTTLNASFLVESTPASSIQVNYAPGATTGGTVSIYYVFFKPGVYPPANSQPPLAFNSHNTSAANAAVTATLTPNGASGDVLASVYVYSVSARCSAGSAQLTIADSTKSTTLWNTAATEVGTTTFKYQWNPGLVASINVGDVATVTLGTCGAANTGTLDVQASIF